MSDNKLDTKIIKSFENYEAPGSENLKLMMSKKITRFNFFKFNFASFNIFYLTLAIVGIILILGLSSITKNETNNGENDNQTESNLDLLKKSKESNIKTADTIETQNNEENIIIYSIRDTNTSETHQTNTDQPIKSINTTKNTVKTDSQIINPTVIDKNAPISLDVDNKSKKLNDNSDKIESPITKKIVYDTVVSNVNVTIKDTVKTVVRETIKVKKPRKRDK